MSNNDYKEVVIDNDAIVNTEPKELPEEAQNIPQGVKPQLNPNPGYGYVDPATGKSETKPAIKTDLVEGERGTPVDVVTPATEGIKVERNLVNFINGILVKGKKIEDYIEGADELDEFYKVVTNNTFTVSADDFAKASNQKPAVLTLAIGTQKFDLVKTSVASSVVTFENNTYIAKFTKSGSDYTGYVKEQQKFNVGDIISLGTLDLTSEGAQFEVTVPTLTYISIPSSGLAIIMFNTTCVIIPYTKAQHNRFVCSAIYDGNGNSMVARGKLSFTSSGIAGGKITIVFDSNFKDAAYDAGLTPPSGIIRFVEF